MEILAYTYTALAYEAQTSNTSLPNQLNTASVLQPSHSEEFALDSVVSEQSELSYLVLAI